ncbi:glycosyltransferase family 1 protein [Pedobacter sp. BS3]|uniref:glycosyltransferase family 4 protein n=1 Tax=Pedobacter sp. BS3 TaxID=2567937 RepID=UPI0011EFC4DA|nr:glycosyltransferase family 1 protein [Pedobacter sp. BS3]TZF83695.1 glycosyltransferase family 1 protein [Pedobacter sp. BS3]
MKNKIAFISEHASPLATLGGADSGGQNVYVAELAKHLVTKGYEVDIFTRWDDPQLSRVVNWLPGIRIIHAEAGPVCYIPKEELLEYIPEFTESMLAFIQQEGISYQLVHANFWMSGMVACELKAILNIPFVITFHALGYIRLMYQKEADKFPVKRVAIEEEIVKYADHIIAECPQDKDDLTMYYHAAEDKISIIPCGFSKQEFYPIQKTLARKRLGLNPNDNIILQLGRMVPRKGIDNVIKAMGKLKNLAASTRLLVVGGDTDKPDPALSPELARLQDIAHQEKVFQSVIFAGRKNRDILKYYYSAADIFVTTPWYEPFGITPLEAMACGTPVIGSDVGGIKYSVTHNHTGFLVPPNNPQALAEKIRHLLTDKSTMFKMRHNAIKRVNAVFTWSHVANQVAALYQHITQPVKQVSSSAIKAA